MLVLSCTQLHSIKTTSVRGALCHQSHSHIPLGKQPADNLAFQEYQAIICCFCLIIAEHFVSISESGLTAAAFPLLLLALSDETGLELFSNLAVGHTGGGELRLLIKHGIAEHRAEKQYYAASQTIL